MKKNILFVSHKKAQCGVYEFGKSITAVLSRSEKYNFIRVECSSLDELNRAIGIHNPDAIIYNYVPPVLPWIATRTSRLFYRNNIASVRIPQIGIIHEVVQSTADRATAYKKKILFGRTRRLYNSLFDFYIAPDPTLLLRNTLVYKTGRLIPDYENNFPLPRELTIGSFGFGTPGKGFEKIVEMVQNEFDEATIRFNIPAADFVDKQGRGAKAIAERCRAMITKPGITLVITHDFFDIKGVLDFLAKNTINVFLYEDKGSRGISSAVDNAIAVKRPIAISDSSMFRHLLDAKPSICISKNQMGVIIKNGFAPLEPYYHEWSAENLLWDYERIMGSIFERLKNPTKPKRSIVGRIYSKWRRIISKPDRSFTWLGDSTKATDDDMNETHSESYAPVQLPLGAPLNRILDNNARELYTPAIQKLIALVPKTMAKKISAANVQQGFVFDTVWRFMPRYQNPKLLCVGSYEDTASMGLMKMGVRVDEIDPMLNYSLQEYSTKPSTAKHSYDIIFSTSVIEHVPDDESFVACVADLLAPGGVFVMTCDYQEGWVSGKAKPGVDARLYTQQDLGRRLLSMMPGCKLVGQSQWGCPHPDFHFGNCTYTFATFVVEKEK